MSGLITVRALGFTYEEASRPALRDVDLHVDAGELVGVVGANGAGKSTLLRALAGIVPHFYPGELRGTVEVAGVDVPHTRLGETTRKVGYVFDNPLTQISGAKATVYEELAFGLENHGVPRREMIRRIDRVVEQVGLASLVDRPPFSLSGGELQRLALGSVLVLEPPVLVFDEPTSQLDPTATSRLLALVEQLRDAGAAVVVAEHDVDWLAGHADRLVALADGEVVASGTPAAVYRGERLDPVGVPLPTTVTVARRLGWRRPDGGWPVTVSQAVEAARRP